MEQVMKMKKTEPFWKDVMVAKEIVTFKLP